MNRSELIRRMVLNSICDDYENIDQVILRDVAQDAVKLGFTVERSEIVDALAGLIEDGLAKATYFYITKKGMDLHLSDDTWWPFDDEGEPEPVDPTGK